MKTRLFGVALVLALLLSSTFSGAMPVSAQSEDSSDQDGPTHLFLPYVHGDETGEEVLLQPAWGLDVWEGVEWIEDCVTGNNQFYNAETGGVHWYVNQTNPDGPGAPGCDSYWTETYERPVDQVFAELAIDEQPAPPYPSFTPDDATFLSGLGPDGEFAAAGAAVATDSGPYFEYVDITRARYTSHGDWLYFQMELFGKHQVTSEGARIGRFADDAQYTIRLGNNPDTASNGADPNSGIILRNGLEDGIKPWWRWGWGDVSVYRDGNGDAGGQGVNVTQDGTQPPSGDFDTAGDGYELDMGNPFWLFVRSTTAEYNGATRPVVEFAFNYQYYNKRTEGPDFTPENITFVQYDATREMEDTGNYFYNDEYALAELGSPYVPAGDASGACWRGCDKPPKPEYTPQIDTLREQKEQPVDLRIEVQKFTEGFGESDDPIPVNEFGWRDANSLEVAAVSEEEPIWRYVVRKIGADSLYNVSISDEPGYGNGAPFVVNEIANLPDGDPEIRRECRLVDSATYQSWTEPWGFVGYVWDQPGLETPADLSNIVLDDAYPVLVCDINGQGLVSLAELEVVIIEDVLSIWVPFDTYFNTAQATATGETGTGMASDLDDSYYVSVTCCGDLACYPIERQGCSQGGGE